MKILMLVNWKVAYENQIPEGKQPPDYVVPGQKYWFFRYLSDDISVDVVDIRSFPWLERFEKEKIRFYIWQTLKVLPKLNQYDLVLSHGMQSGIVLCLWRRLFGHGNMGETRSKNTSDKRTQTQRLPAEAIEKSPHQKE